jgi:hypothetical protein
MLPSAKSNTGAVALQYWLYNWLSKQVDGKLRTVTKEAIRTGVIFDHKEEPLPGGTVKQVYSDDMVAISVSVNQPTSSVKWDRVRQALVDGGYIGEHDLGDIVHRHTVKNAAAHKFSSVLIEKEPSYTDNRAEPSMS